MLVDEKKDISLIKNCIFNTDIWFYLIPCLTCVAVNQPLKLRYTNKEISILIGKGQSKHDDIFKKTDKPSAGKKRWPQT